MEYNFDELLKGIPKLTDLLEKTVEGLDGILEKANDDMTKEDVEKLAPDLKEMNSAIDMAAGYLGTLNAKMSKTHRK